MSREPVNDNGPTPREDLAGSAVNPAGAEPTGQQSHGDDHLPAGAGETNAYDADGFGSIQPRWLKERTGRNSLPDAVAMLRRIDAEDPSPRPEGIGGRSPEAWQNHEMLRDEEFSPVEDQDSLGRRSPIVRIVLYIALIVALIAGFNWLFAFHFDGGRAKFENAVGPGIAPTIAPPGAGVPSGAPSYPPANARGPDGAGPSVAPSQPPAAPSAGQNERDRGAAGE